MDTVCYGGLLNFCFFALYLLNTVFVLLDQSEAGTVIPSE